MLLWNDFEGKTIADTFSLGPLVRPEGRSALFALSKGADAPALIRLTESINDESQMLARWSLVSQVKQENLLPIKRFGETNFEGTPLTYAVMEPADANLDDLLKERPLTHPEALQVAASVVAALQALHSKDLVHGHVAAVNVLAVGETVKLRTDCVRECVVDGEFITPQDCARMRQRDVHDLALLLLRSLTLENELKPAVKLPEPFNRIIPNAIEGAWGFAEIARELAPPAAPARVPAVAKTVPAQTPTAATTAVAAQPELNFAAAAETAAEPETHAGNPLRFQRRINSGSEPRTLRTWMLPALAIVLVVAIVAFVHFSGGSKAPAAAQVVAQPAPRVIVKTPPATPVAAPVAAHAAAPTAEPATTSSGNPSVAAMHAGWYVIAYTFNRTEQAAIRAAAIAKKTPLLEPEIVAPGGHSPYLIALGGAMTKPQADAMQKRARQSGMPRDTFVRNYKGD